MKIKKFLESKYYGLKEVHAFNSFLKNLPPSMVDYSLAEELFKLSEIRGSYEDPSKYVPGSESYNKIVQENLEYQKAQERLKEYGHSREQLLDECYPDYIYLYRHTITYSVTQRHTEYWGEDEVSEPNVVDVTGFFYSTGFYGTKVLMNPSDLRLPYENPQGHDPDIIKTYIDTHNATTKRLIAYMMCAEMKWDVDIFLKVFDVDTITIQGVGVFDETANKTYYAYDVKRLMEDFQSAASKKYIRGDEYVDYPHYGSYVRFLEKLGVEYLEIPA